MKRNIVFFILLFVANAFYAQEFRCSVSVSATSIQGTNRQVFETLQKSLNEFMNGQKWTDNVFAPEERIECSVMIVIKEAKSDRYSGSIQIQARRPVYDSGYMSNLINIQDKDFSFRYTEFEPLVFNISTFESNLVGVLAFYSYYILGLDYDSFSNLGGTKYLEKAQKIVSNAQNSSDNGWRSYESTKNRYWLIKNYMSEDHKALRHSMYQYYRKGMDLLTSKPENARKEVLEVLEKLRKIYRNEPTSHTLQTFISAHSDEIINIFSESFSLEKGKVIEIMSEIDSSNADKYKKSLSK